MQINSGSNSPRNFRNLFDGCKSQKELRRTSTSPRRANDKKTLKFQLVSNMKQHGLLSNAAEYRQLISSFYEAFGTFDRIDYDQHDSQQAENYLTEILMHFMLDLSVEQVKTMCKCYIQTFMKNRKAIAQGMKDESIDDLVPQKYETVDSNVESAQIEPSP